MPRAFLINHKRHSLGESLQDREKSPEFHVNTAESIDKGSCCCPTGIAEQPLHLNHGISRPGLERVNNGNIIIKKTHCTQKGSQNIAVEHVLAGTFKSHEQCEDEFYNLTKLAEVSLAAAAGQLFYKNSFSTRFDFGKWPEQEFPEDLSRDVSLSGSSDSKPTEIHVCPECEKKYSTSSNLARHRQTHRSLADKKARTCPHCDKIYVSMPAFSMHVRTHNQGCKCPYCGKCFSRPWLLQGHIRTHTGEKPFKCSVCTKAFADKSNLRAHIQTHSNMKPYVCGRCGKAFALKSYLYKHEESSCMRGQSTNDRKFSEQGKKKIPPKTKSDDTEKLPVKSIQTPVISIAIKV